MHGIIIIIIIIIIIMIAEISVQSAANEIREDWKPTFLCNEEFSQLMLEVRGFLFFSILTLFMYSHIALCT